MATRFERDTRLTRVGEGVFTGSAPQSWLVARGVNGGFVAAAALRAAQLHLADPTRQPRSLTLHFVAPLEPGPYTVEVRTERAGRSLTTLSMRVLQTDRLCALALSAFATPRQSILLSSASMPDVPPPEECPRLGDPEDDAFSFRGNYEYRLAVGDLPFTGSSEARTGGWLRLADPLVADAPVVAALTDAWLPSVFPRLPGPAAVPTVDLTIHLRADVPLPEARPEDYYLAVFSSRLGRDGFFEEDGEVWSRSGLLIAQSRQLALLPPT